MDKTSTNSQLGQKSDRIKSLDTNLDFYNSKAKVNASSHTSPGLQRQAQK
ncbi:hypothetical protein H4N54_00805 [Limnospira fusiformis KN01]|uniref:Uncharacterized protein n=1 Tax=Limnospira fusiformis PMC 851.14 TaxID=2219512 RepID=A0ABU9ETW0_LIMFS|nr:MULTISPECIES: hypothetical protein [Limnospira]EKD09209.1 hypothetical protein SPLC1_S206100 [Arthrospira platensis C1]MDC0837717.1 hypothetical protein [Limnoraphis robusta]QJB24619.1 hypothetical protein HFV01_00970 [Limnospira fusiformis SAG 85.79]QNH57211.1 MAG: hypothetical protein H2674_24350 [Limnospira indica BM01]ULB45975.1 hypothetical protein H4N54_00805 [Limnospira fusiformis KN01]